MTMKNDAKFEKELTFLSKYLMNSINFDVSTQESQTFKP